MHYNNWFYLHLNVFLNLISNSCSEEKIINLFNEIWYLSILNCYMILHIVSLHNDFHSLWNNVLRRVLYVTLSRATELALALIDCILFVTSATCWSQVETIVCNLIFLWCFLSDWIGLKVQCEDTSFLSFSLLLDESIYISTNVWSGEYFRLLILYANICKFYEGIPVYYAWKMSIMCLILSGCIHSLYIDQSIVPNSLIPVHVLINIVLLHRSERDFSAFVYLAGTVIYS